MRSEGEKKGRSRPRREEEGEPNKATPAAGPSSSSLLRMSTFFPTASASNHELRLDVQELPVHPHLGC